MLAIYDLLVRIGHSNIGPISMTIPRGGYAVLMGASGTGKTTILEALCGLRPVVSGHITLEGRDITRTPSAKRGIGYVPQDGALFPTMTVFDHLAFPLRLRRWPAARITERVNTLAEELGVTALLSRLPQALSGGERQRVALGRALSIIPEILVLDEPLSALDEDSSDYLIDLLSSLHCQRKYTVLHVTHNSREARQLATQIFNLSDVGIASQRLLQHETWPTCRLLATLHSQS